MARETARPTTKAKAKRKAAKSKPKTAVKKPAAVVKKVTKAPSPAKKNPAGKTSPKKAVAKTAAKKVTTAKKTASKQVKRTTAKKATPVKSTAKRPAPKMNPDNVIKEFRNVVNLTPAQLERWLSLPDSKKLGFKDEVKAGTRGHESGRRILKILGKRRDKYTDDDLRHMQTVVGFVRDHLTQKPPGDIIASNWRYSLMNWGHDPTKQRTR